MGKTDVENLSIGLVEYGCGNIQSIKNALAAIGIQKIYVIRSESDLIKTEKIILPGVGAFDAGMQALKERQMIQPLLNFISEKRNKLLGICLGMQLLCESSEEGLSDGLGMMDANVVKMKQENNVKIPHMGWNTVEFKKSDPLFVGLGESQDFYFVHSYKVVLNDTKAELGRTMHGDVYTSVFRHENIWGVQFHPEKSQNSGLRLLNNFIRHA